MKRILLAISILCAFGNIAQAQDMSASSRSSIPRRTGVGGSPLPAQRTPSDQQNQMIVEYSLAELGRMSRRTAEPGRMSRQASADSYNTFKSSVVVENTAAKVITSVNWRVSLVNSETNTVTNRFDVTEKVRIKPGKRKALTARLLVPPGTDVKLGPSGKPHSKPATRSNPSLKTVLRVESAISRITYADGTFTEVP